jgi:mono/diheme cytochrome c family protein
MRITKLAIVVAVIALALFLLLPNLSWAEDGASLYKTKCAACHGADGAGKPAAKIPAIVSDEVKKMSDDDLTAMITEGGKAKKATHAFGAKGVTPDQVKMLVSYIRDLNKK